MVVVFTRVLFEARIQRALTVGVCQCKPVKLIV